ncbi:MAG: hypothetical protein DWP94_09595 [Flavobacterium sp.]|nr:MAG: hypothetical protein DWP94_09595 [Flavobacterium sp.]
MDQFFNIIGYIAIGMTIISTILYSIRFASNNRAYRIFTFYLIAISSIQLIALYIGKGYLHKNNLFMSHFYFGLQFILLSLFYAELIGHRLIKILIIPILLFLAYQFINDPGLFFIYNPLGITITQILLVVYTMIYFYRSLNKKTDFILVNIGVFLYLISSTLIFASGNLVLDLDLAPETKSLFIDINRILILLFQILIIAEWYRHYRVKPANT